MKKMILILAALFTASLANAKVAENEMSLEALAEQLEMPATELFESLGMNQGEKIFISQEADYMSITDSFGDEEIISEFRRGKRHRHKRRHPRHRRHRRFPRHRPHYPRHRPRYPRHYPRHYPRRHYPRHRSLCPWGTMRVKIGGVRLCVRVGY